VGRGNGAVSVFDHDDKDSLQRTRVFSFATDAADPVHVARGRTGNQLAVTTAGGKIYTLSIASMEILKQDEDNFDMLAGMDLPAEVRSPQWCHSGRPWHDVHGAGGAPDTWGACVRGVSRDGCVRRPLIATCSTDRGAPLRWQGRVSLELKVLPGQEAFSIAIHPSGAAPRGLCRQAAHDAI
jgi:hypothetical protein